MLGVNHEDTRINRALSAAFDTRIEKLSKYLDGLIQREISSPNQEKKSELINRFKSSEHLGNIKLALINFTEQQINTQNFNVKAEESVTKINQELDKLLNNLEEDLKTSFNISDQKASGIIKNMRNGFKLDALSNLISLKELGVINLSDQDFSNRDLRHWSLLDLSDVNFTNANFSKSDLRCLNFDKNIMTGANFTDANLQGTSLREANLSAANLSNANLSVDQETEYIFNARGYMRMESDKDNSRKFVEAGKPRIQNNLLRGVILNGANLSQANFIGADLEAASLKDVNAQGARFIGTNLSEAHLSGNFNEADFTNAFLIMAKFEPSTWDTIIFNKTDLRAAVLSEAFQQFLKNEKHEQVYLESLEKRPPEIEEKIQALKNSLSEASNTQEPLLKLITNTWELFPGLAIGEDHSDVKHRYEIARLMPDLKKAGLSFIALEINHRFQKDLDSFMNVKESEGAEENLNIFINNFCGNHPTKDSWEALLKAAKKNQVNIICADSDNNLTPRRYDDGNNRINLQYTANQAQWCGPIRQGESEPFIVERIQAAIEASIESNPKYLMIFGSGHVCPDPRRTDAETEKAYSQLGLATLGIRSDITNQGVRLETAGAQANHKTQEMYKTHDFLAFI
ncbi:MAG: pentapeptide repeat-containing protein [Candidatus Melainabacteria bacterium]|nr:pentapeptide repeat-containing protein [Candidatus Melainabacteria bacterium]